MKNRLAAALVAAALVVGGVSVAAPALATPPADLVCPSLDSGKIDTTGDPATVTVTAPEGKLISGYCVKAGPGFEMIVVDPPLAQVVVDHPTKDSVSHYSLSYVEAPVVEPTTVTARVTFICKVTEAGTITNAPGTYAAGDYIFRIRHEAGPATDYTAGVGGAGLFAGNLTVGEVEYLTTQTPVAGVSIKTSPLPNTYKGTASTNETACGIPPLPEEPETVIVYGDWVTGEYECDDTQVSETRTVTTTTYSLVDRQWVANDPVVTTEERTRDLTAEEIDALFCPGPKPDPIVEAEEWSTTDCEAGFVTTTTVTTTTNWELSGEEWVQTRPVSEIASSVRPVTEEECPTPVPPLDPPLVDREPLAYTGGSADVIGYGSLGAALLLGLGIVASLAAARRRV